MALRTDDFHAVTPEGKLNDRADMEQYIRGFLNGIDRWISTSIDIALAPTRPRWHGYLYKREEVGIMVPVEWFSDRDPSLTGGNELMAKKKAAKKAKAKKKPAKKKKK